MFETNNFNVLVSLSNKINFQIIFHFNKSISITISNTFYLKSKFLSTMHSERQTLSKARKRWKRRRIEIKMKCEVSTWDVKRERQKKCRTEIERDAGAMAGLMCFTEFQCNRCTDRTERAQACRWAWPRWRAPRARWGRWGPTARPSDRG